MLLAIQFPLADSRKFLDTSSRITKPVWPLPEPDSEFVRCFGSIRERKAGGIAGWGSENENIICEADQAFSFRTDLSLIDRAAKFRLILRRAFSRFYFDGQAVGKLEVGVATKKHSKVVATQQQTRKIINHFLHLPVQISNLLGGPSNCSLVQAGKDLAQLYLIASTYNKFRLSTTSTNWQVQSGAPLLFLEYQDYESIEVPIAARSVSLAEEYGFQLFRYVVPYEGRRTNMWLLGRGAKTDYKKVRTLRMYLLRLHAEHECLRLILRNVMLGNIVVTRGTKASDSLQEYFDQATTKIKSLETKSKQDFTSEIAEIARKATDLISLGTSDTLLASVEKLDPRRNVLRKVKEYVEAVGSVQQLSLDLREGAMTSFEGDQINISGGVVGAVKNLGIVTQNIGNIPNADQATKDELKQLVEQLTALLKNVPEDKADEAAAVAETTKQLVDTAAKEKPNKTMVQITAEGLKKAAENIASVLPAVLPIATKIATTIMKVAGVPVPF